MCFADSKNVICLNLIESYKTLIFLLIYYN